MIRLAKSEDIPRLQELLEQILIVHHQARPEPGQCHRKDHGRRYGNECRQHSGKNGTT